MSKVSGIGRSSPLTSQAILSFIRKRGINAACYLDMGGSDGSLTVQIGQALNAEEIHVVDISDEALVIAASKGLQTHKVDLNSQRLPFPDAHFDFITMVEVLEHLVDTDHALREANRVLKPLGYLLITTPNLASWRNRILLLFGFYPEFAEVSFRISFSGRKPKIDEKPSELGSKHIRLYTLGALKFQLEYYGFSVENQVGIPTKFESAPRTIFYRILAYIDAFLSRRASLAPSILILAKKRAENNSRYNNT
jgi:SAM-dependent methyltransferase